MENKQELHEKLMADYREAKKIITEFKLRMEELQEKSITEYGRLWIQAYAPVEIDGEFMDTFYDQETNKRMYNYSLSEIEIVPLTFAGNLNK